MPSIPPPQTTGRVYWRVETDYLPPGATSPITSPARGQVKFEPLRQSTNIGEADGTSLGLTLGYQTRFLTLDANGVIDRYLLADYANAGWDYRVTPMLQTRRDDGSWGPASTDLSTPFAFHLASGATVDLADVRPLGLIGSGGVVTQPAPAPTATLKGQVANQAALPTGAATGDQYVTTDTYHLWQWSGSAWVDLGPTTSGSGTSAPPSTLSTTDMTV